MATHALQQQLRGESRVLILASGEDNAEQDLCLDLLSGDKAGETQLMYVAYGHRPSELVEAYRGRCGELPASLAVVCPDERAPRPSALPSAVHVTGVDATDLTGLSIAVSRYLDDWEGGGRPVTVCFDSLGAVLADASRDRVFRFLHTLTGRFMAADASAHVHLDPSTADDRTVATLSTLFDAVVRPDGTGWTVAEG